MSLERPPPCELPAKQDILDFISKSKARIAQRDIARAFGIKGNDKIALKALLKEMKDEGLIEKGQGRSLIDPARLPPVTIIEVTGVDTDGELMGRPTVWHASRPPPPIYMAPERKGRTALGIGERVLARLTKTGQTTQSGQSIYEAQTIRVIAGAPQEILGVFHTMGKHDRGDGQIESTDRRHKTAFAVERADFGGAQNGELVAAHTLEGRHKGLPRARVIERLGHTDDPGAISLVVIHAQDIPTQFPNLALAQAKAANPVSLGKDREDLRDLPLVTIDGADARDFDDAVYAQADDNPDNPGGWKLVVAIADVAHYVRPGDALDLEAYKRGNSTYFPDRVVPMLPEELSNNLCSLRPDEDRPTLVAKMTIDTDGKLLNHHFVRALIRSSARLTYEQAQQARNGNTDRATAPLMEKVIKPLYGAYACLLKARAARGALELDLPERQVVLGKDGHIASIEPRLRLDSHKLIEEFMITANVAAARTLDKKRRPCLYRVHEPPSAAKIEALRDFIKDFGYKFSLGQVIEPRHFTQILEKAADTDHAHLISEIVLRSQSKADYRPESLSHFGLALRHYAHFTSPIRRYADLVVHRSLIDAFKMGDDGLGQIDAESFAEIGEHISQTERRSEKAERDAFDRYSVAFLKDRVGARFKGRINGVTRFGLFVTLDQTGADGLVTARSMRDDYYIHDEERHCLRGRHTGKTYTLGENVTVNLTEANPVTGGMIFELVEDDAQSSPNRRSRPGSRPGKGPGQKKSNRKGKNKNKGKPKSRKNVAL